MKELLDTPGVRDQASFLASDLDPYLSKMKGKAFFYPIDAKLFNNQKLYMMELDRVIKEHSKGHKFEALPQYKYTFAIKRGIGRTWPGEERRQLRKTLERKETRRQAAMLCKYMVYKGGKFLPGKMV